MLLSSVQDQGLNMEVVMSPPMVQVGLVLFHRTNVDIAIIWCHVRFKVSSADLALSYHSWFHISPLSSIPIRYKTEVIRTPSVLRGRVALEALEAPRRLLFQSPIRMREVTTVVFTCLTNIVGHHVKATFLFRFTESQQFWLLEGKCPRNM